MARIRTVKPEFFQSDTVSRLPFRTRIVFIGLWTHVDDEGRCKDHPRLIRAALFPLEDDVTAQHIEDDLTTLASAGLVIRYEAGGDRFLAVRSWAEHQKINRPTASKFPVPPGFSSTVPPPFSEDSRSDHGDISDDSPTERKGSGSGKEDEPMRESSVIAPVVPIGSPHEPASAGRARDELFDAVIEACGIEYESMTERERKAAGVAVAQIKKAQGRAEDVVGRAAAYGRKFKGRTMTPNDLAKNWGACAPRRTSPDNVIGGAVMSAGAMSRW